MPLGKYFKEEKIELLFCKIESFIGIKLKIKLWWLINETRLEERLKSSNKKELAIVMTVRNSIKAFQLYSKS